MAYIIENRTLLGVDTIAPLVATSYVYAYSKGITPLPNNQVRISVDTSSGAECNIELPPISSFNGNYDVQIIVQDIGGNTEIGRINVSNALILGEPSGDLMNGNFLGCFIKGNYGSMILTISSEGRWIATGYSTTQQPI